ncbi:MarR family winged helix-turn-helix transcriptional regulator [Pseudaminobacter soli (ex Li et al. 2025)]|uniref:Transcriptional regulator n=1 Tax=Pseudaminobacter soli (ex Li et al. 2025) TaxID=1295366 RepID=A0A2P7SKX3_9HYPH|nr:MarR family transcriptional regulator [Mesorhizobium soli]PSJ63146.1 transcriptional regulator [Mesorhizobium soli]
MWRRAADRKLEDRGLSHATAVPLVALSRLGDNIRQGAIADYLALEGPSLVRIADIPASEGLIVRIADPADRRAKLLSLTDAGRARVVEIEAILERLRCDLLSEEDERDMEGAAALLIRLGARLLANEPQA